MSDVFISYAREDRAHAERLARALEGRGWSVWWDRSIPTGRTFDEVIEEAIDAARCIVVVWSERSVASRWVRNEAEEGAKRSILVPIRIEEVELPLAFRRIQTLDLIGWEGAPDAPEIETLLADIAAIVEPRPREEGESGRQAESVPQPPAEVRASPPPEVETALADGAKVRRWRGTLLQGIAAILVAYGLWGLLGLPQTPYWGFWWGRGNEVTRIFAHGPAARAGIEKGDIIAKVNGIPVAEWDGTRRPEVDETWTFEVERGGETLALQLTNVGLPASRWAQPILSFAVGLSTLAFCLWAYSEAPSAASGVLALFGLSFCPAFLGFLGLGPLDAELRHFMGKLFQTLIVFGLVFLVHFLLLFPKRRSLLDKAGGLNAVYFPAVVVALVYLVELFAGAKLGEVILLVYVGYFTWALVLVSQSFIRASPRERSEHHLGLVLGGVLLGLLPSAILLVVSRLAPTVVLPGSEFYTLSVGLIPVACAIAAVRGQRAAVAA